MDFKVCVFLCLLPLALVMPDTTKAGVTDKLAPCVLFLIQEVPPGQNAKIGSGFFVRKDKTSYIVTAGHVSKAIGNNFQIIMPTNDGKADKAKILNADWVESKVADVAIAKVILEDPKFQFIVTNRSFDYSYLSARPLPPSRDITLTVMGYPLGLGASGYVSPISIETRAASGYITLNRFDNNKPATFILLQDPSIGGLSGGPVFDTGKMFFGGERTMTVRSGISIVGIVHGVISDETGGKFSAVVPSTEIVMLLEKG